LSNLQDALVELNPWWKGEYTVKAHPRELETELEPFLPTRMMVALTGVRRCGKTTLLLRLGQREIQGGLDPRRVVYFSFDEHRGASLRDVVQAWESAAHQSRNDGRVMFLFDEIQKVDGWADSAKALYDRYHNFKFILSGSESLFIRRGKQESLAGRVFEFEVAPLSLREYLDFAGVPREPLELQRADILRAMEGFLQCQGLPELVGQDDRGVIRKYIRENVVEKVAYRDLPQILGLQNPGAIEAMLHILMDDPGQLIEVQDLGSEVGLAPETASWYLRYLEQSFLLRKLYNWSPNRRKVERKLKKYYPTFVSPSVAANLDDAVRGRILEWLVVTQTRPGFFWRDPYKHEVDMVLDGPQPVEVKLTRLETDGLSAFFRKFKARRGTIVTWDRAETLSLEGKPIEVVPAYEFLLRKRKVAD
jgi:uncharacterized protein